MLAGKGYPHVPINGAYQNLYEVIKANYDWMNGGFGEGIIIITPNPSSNINILKWKNGLEQSGDHEAIIEQILKQIEERNIFKENTTKAKELFKLMNEVANSKLENGILPKLVNEKQG